MNYRKFTDNIFFFSCMRNYFLGRCFSDPVIRGGGRKCGGKGAVDPAAEAPSTLRPLLLPLLLRLSTFLRSTGVSLLFSRVTMEVLEGASN